MELLAIIVPVVAIALVIAVLIMKRYSGTSRPTNAADDDSFWLTGDPGNSSDSDPGQHHSHHNTSPHGGGDCGGAHHGGFDSGGFDGGGGHH